MKLNLNENAIKILEKRYLDAGETPMERFTSMANKMASIEGEHTNQWAERFLTLFCQQRVLPNTPAIVNYGKEKRQQQGSACFVLPIKDDLNDIFDTIRKAALIHKSGGGTGYNFSSLRPNGSIVYTTGKFSSGVIPFIKAYDAATGAVSQGGTRRGANMGILNVNHPDIISFITCKSDNDDINNFNLSVGVTEEFFEAVKNDLDWELYFEGEDGKRVWMFPNGDESQPLVTEIVVKAKYIYELILQYAHKNGEPGIIFVDRLQQYNSVPSRVIVATNPCGEQPLPPDNSCVLASHNLAKYVSADWKKIDWNSFDKDIEVSVRMLDNIVTINEYPIEQIKIHHDEQRRIGLGITGLGDVLIMLGAAYGSSEGREIAGTIMKFLNDKSHYWSYMLGKEKGNFPLFKESKFNLNGEYREEAIAFYKSFLPKEEFEWLIESGLDGFQRNAATTTVAPTGSLTSLLGCECYGGEPMFAPGYIRTIMEGTELVYVSALFEIVARREGFYSEEIIKKVANNGSALIKGVPAKWREVFRNANEISVENHIEMQAMLQRYCDSGISKTINMAASATIEDVSNAFWQANNSGIIKGITVYRDKSRSSAPINVGIDNEEDKECDCEGSCEICNCEIEQKLSLDDISYVDEKTVEEIEELNILAKEIIEGDTSNIIACPSCGFPMQRAGGCPVCLNCGFSKCG